MEFWQSLGLFFLFVGWCVLVWLSITSGRTGWALTLMLALIVVLNIAPVVIPD